MSLRRYPLRVLHHYEMQYAEVEQICRLVARQSRRSLAEIPGIPRRRIDTLPHAAIVLQSILLRMKPKSVIISASGVREGLLYDDLDGIARRLDPLIEGCRFYASHFAPCPSFGEAVLAVVEPLFAPFDAGGVRRRRAAAYLCDIGAYFHPDLRARHVFETALGAPFVGLDHRDRVWIAVALNRRHQGRSSALPDERMIGLLPREGQQNAVRFGAALRFLADFSPKLTTAAARMHASA